ncbi:MAG: hypothetical protein ACD_62C00172G0001 [uncultured bacterium]|nr:MAG: hypothetical protein ACD_62C00172G0001 [uncultured bacterium]
MILYYPLFKGTVFEVDSYTFGVVCVVVGAFFAIASAVQYSIRFFKIVGRQ